MTSTDIALRRLASEALIMLQTHQTLLLGNGTLKISTPHQNDNLLCIEEIFQGIGTLKNHTTKGHLGTEAFFHGLSSLRDHISIEEKKCRGPRRNVGDFLKHLQIFLQQIKTDGIGRKCDSCKAAETEEAEKA
ncbi:interleukin-5 [Ornithorhynchus anatinus]|nr:interleukin-5 [Ornithorhynchus anatinus]